MSKKAIIIFIKNPIKGNVKTRLAKDLGDDGAMKVYKKLLTHTREVVEQVESTRFLFYKDEILDDDWNSSLFEKRVQADGDLGNKMKQAFQEVFNQGFTKVLIIGSDCPAISKEIIDEAFYQLESNNVVLGPANDGGYYLMGMNTLHDSIFDLKAWSTDQVLSETVSRILQSNLSFSLIQELVDIDTLDDLKNYPAFE